MSKVLLLSPPLTAAFACDARPHAHSLIPLLLPATKVLLRPPTTPQLPLEQPKLRALRSASSKSTAQAAQSSVTALQAEGECPSAEASPSRFFSHQFCQCCVRFIAFACPVSRD